MSADVAERSANGRWSRGQQYNPEQGNHKGHTVEIVNPAAVIKVPVPTRQDGEVVIMLKEASVVYVRCETCLMSWFFGEAEEV